MAAEPISDGEHDGNARQQARRPAATTHTLHREPFTPTFRPSQTTHPIATGSNTFDHRPMPVTPV
ncbi:hypothetical protein ACLOJK_001524 [Asimina triloba]